MVNAEYLPGDVEPGDVVAVATTGAYCYSLASNYNAVPRPAMVWVNGSKHGVMVQRETIADVLRLDQGLSG